MKIAVNTRFLIKDSLEGIGVFTYEIFKRLTKKHPEHTFYFIFDRIPDSEFIFSDNIVPVVIGPPARHPVLWYLWFEFSVKKILRKIKPDIFISPDGFIPLDCSCRTIAVFHDIAFEHYPQDVPFAVRKYYLYFFPKFAQKATRIVTVSEFSKKDICDTYGISENKIDVVFNGAGETFAALDEAQKINIKREISENREYFFYVGALHARKNINNLLKGYDLFRSKSNSDIKLVIAGRKAWKTRSINTIFRKMTYRKDVIFTGRISGEKLRDFIGAAYALTYLSYFEGFGLPLVEAFYCDVPAITSNCSALPEIAGKAALLADPFDINDIASKMKLIAEDKSVRNSLIENAKLVRQKFNWDKTADLLWLSVLQTIQT